MDKPATTSKLPTPTKDSSPVGQGGALVGEIKKDSADRDPANPVEPRPANRDANPAQTPPGGRDGGTGQADRRVVTPEATPRPAPAAAAPSAPARDVASEPVVSSPAQPAAPQPVRADELDSAFRAVFAPGASDAQLASAFESGPTMIPVGRALAEGLPLLGGAVQWHLANVAGTGDRATGQWVITTPLGQRIVPMEWVRHGEQWKVSTSSTCALGLAILGGCAPA